MSVDFLIVISLTFSANPITVLIGISIVVAVTLVQAVLWCHDNQDKLKRFFEFITFQGDEDIELQELAAPSSANEEFDEYEEDDAPEDASARGGSSSGS